MKDLLKYAKGQRLYMVLAAITNYIDGVFFGVDYF